MKTRYFKLSENVYAPGRWHLDDPVDAHGQAVGPGIFGRGEPTHVERRLRLPLYRPGKPLDFSFLTGTTIPVVHARVASILEKLAPSDVQLFPVTIDGQQNQEYFIVNATRAIRCIDDQHSEEVEHWRPEDGDPLKVGQYVSVSGMQIDPERVGEARVFRTWGWLVALIVVDEIKEAIERLGVTGAEFTAV